MNTVAKIDLIYKYNYNLTDSFYLQPPALEHRNGVIKGYFVGYKETHSTAQFQFITKDVDDNDDDPNGVVAVFIQNLKKFTEYTVNVKSYNKKGMGPASSDIDVSTLEDGNVPNLSRLCRNL